MEGITIFDLMDKVKDYDAADRLLIAKAYQTADMLHAGQFRQSGDKYIVHPLCVSYILAEMNADCDTICAGLLHDTLEDTDYTKEDIVREFNQDVAKLVDGVTKISKLNFSSKEDQNYANTRKIITGITEDVRIIIIKLADRLHNMRTLQFKKPAKQKENALETLDIFVPLAYYLGAYRIKSELEDLSLQYLNPTLFNRIAEQKRRVESASGGALEEMLFVLSRMLHDNNLPFDIKLRTKNVYGIYKRIKEGYKISDIHDLLALKICLQEVSNCYYSLGLVHQAYHPINEDFKDYICCPKTNMYQGLHTTVFGPQNKLVQIQLRTFMMDQVASFGLPVYWSSKGNNARDVMQNDLKDKYQFFDSLVEIDEMFKDNQEFVKQVRSELLASMVYVYTMAGEIIELPKGATVIDFAYKVHSDIGNRMVGAYVNGVYVPVETVLQNKDRVRVVVDELSSGPNEEWLKAAVTTRARSKIKEYSKR